MKKIFSLLLYLNIFVLALNGQTNKEITLVVTGEAQTKDLAVVQALRSAIEMSFGTFVSSSTEILNDELVKDEIATVSSGNVKSYQEVACSKTENGYSVTLKATVSLGNLISYAQSKGSSCEFAGQTFAMNMKLKELNKKNELEVFEHLYKQVSLIADDAFDWKIEAGDARVSEDGKGYYIPLTIELLPNKNSAEFLDLIRKTLTSLSLTESEQEEYERINIKMYEVEISLNFGKGLEWVENLYFRNDILAQDIYELFCMPFQNIVYRAHYSNVVKEYECRLSKMAAYPHFDGWASSFSIKNRAYDDYDDRNYKSHIIYRVSPDKMNVLKEFSIIVKRSSDSFNSSSNASSCGIVTDYDGNRYNTVKIGNQCWMKENLRTRHYSDGEIVRGRYYPTSNVANYGYLYNWPAVMHGSSSSKRNPSGVQGICPKGWHVPSEAEWTQLENYVSSQNIYRCGGDAESIAKALASTTGWDRYDDNTCAVGNNPSTNNATGFSAVPAGYYGSGDGYRNDYNSFGNSALFWSATQDDIYYAYYRYLDYHYASVASYNDHKTECYSVRCLRDEENTTPTTPVDAHSCPGTPTVTDIDGNTYNTVQIGSQCWMKENLKTTKYADGTSIPQGTTDSYTDPYWYYPNDNSANKATYGLLYNWKAVMHGSSSSERNPSGVQGICPKGWHVPSDAEWTQLENYVDSREYQCGIAKALASTTGWDRYDDNTCAVGNNQSTNNAAGFSAVPAGNYGHSGYYGFGFFASFWSATQYTSNFASYRSLCYSYARVLSGNNFNKYNGYSVRCLRD